MGIEASDLKERWLSKFFLALAVSSVSVIIYFSVKNNVWLYTLLIAIVIYTVTVLIGSYRRKSILSRADEKKANTVEFFVYFFGLLLVVSSVFYFALKYFEVIRQHFSNTALPLSEIAESLNVIAGVPVAFAGSIVAIVISQRALTITARQERQEDITYIQHQIDKLNSVYWPLVISLRQLLHASIKVRDLKVSDYSAELFQSAVSNLIKALDEINKTGVARECWDESVRINTHRTTELLWSRPNAELLPEYLELEITSLPTLIYALENAMMGVTSNSIISKKEYFFPRQKEEESVPETEKKITHRVKDNPSDYNIVINDVLFSGLLMYSRNIDSDGMGNMYTLNIGAAILADLIMFIPSTKTISECLTSHIESVGLNSKKYGNILKRLMSDIEFQDGIPDGLNNSSSFIRDNPQYLTDSEALLAEINIKDNPYHNYIFTQMI